MRSLFNGDADRLFTVSSLTQVEVRSAIRKRERLQEIDGALAVQAIIRFEQHFQARYIIQSINNMILEEAKALVDRRGLRAYEAIQLAVCLAVKGSAGESAATFVCAERDLLRAAESEGLEVLDPIDQLP
jgi:predicted nucleic acid-binding protein